MRIFKLLTVSTAIMLVFAMTAAIDVNAAVSDPGMKTGSDLLNQNVNEYEGHQEVCYAGKNWFIINYNGTGNQKLNRSGAAALWMVDRLVSGKFNDRNTPTETKSNYGGSLLETTINSYLPGGDNQEFSQGEKEAIFSRTLDGGGDYYGTDGYDPDRIRGDSVANAYLWPLSVEEAEAVPRAICIKSYSWLRSPGEQNKAAVVSSGVYTVERNGRDIDSNYSGVRPAFYLDLSKVLFTSRATGGKVSGTVGMQSLYAVDSYSGSEWKLTLKDSRHADFTATSQYASSHMWTIEYEGAATGENEYISAAAIDGDGVVRAYGRLAKLDTADKAEGHIFLQISKTFGCEDGTKVYVFNEQYNGDGKTDYASDLIEAAAINTIDRVEMNIDAPVCGTLIETPDGADSQTNKPSVTLPEGANYKISDRYPAIWVTNTEAPLDGTTIVGGETYKARVSLSSKSTYLFTDWITGVVNGAVCKNVAGSPDAIRLVADVTAVHDWRKVPVRAATLTDDGYFIDQCEGCCLEDPDTKEPIFRPETFELSNTSYTYDGNAKKPSLTVKDKKGNIIDPSNYDVTYSDNINAGTAKATVTFKGEIYEGSKTLTFTIRDASEQMGTDGTATGPGASAEAAEKAITKMKTDKDPAGSVFAKLKLKSPKQTKTSISLRWTKVSKAKKYVIYGNKCGKYNKPKKLATVTGNTKTFKKIKANKIKKGTYYKFIVVALDKNNNVVSTSKLIHVATKGGKVTNHSKVVVEKSILNKAKSLKKGKTLKLAPTTVKQVKKLTVKKHVALRYESTNKKIATVSKKGVITARKKGTCYVYAYAQNGVFKRIKVVVK